MRKQKLKPKEPIKIRYKELANGNRSIYLDIYFNGKRYYEFLKLYIIPEKTITDKEQNRQTELLAQKYKAQRFIEIQNNNFNVSKKHLDKKCLLNYIDEVANKHLQRTNRKKGLYYNLQSLSKHLQRYKGEKIEFAEVDKQFVKDFIDYLDTATSFIKYNNKAPKLEPNTRYKLFNILKSTLNKAVNDDIINSNPCNKIAISERPKQRESKKEYLTIDEIQKLIDTDCKNEMVKNAFIFCCLTGIRWSDIKKIKYQNFKRDNTGQTELEFRQQKTTEIMYLQISNEAVKWIPEQGDKSNSDNVFILPKNETTNNILRHWTQKAGISKYITFHCSRHTAATLNLTLGTPIEVVSKLLGHSKISTTQIYAKIVNEAKREAVNRQDNIFK